MYMYLFSLITLDDCRVWIHLHGLHRAVRNEKGAEKSKWKYVSSGIRTNNLPNRKQTQCLRPLDHADWDIKLWLKVLHHQCIFIKSTRSNTCVKLIVVKCVLELSDKTCISFTNVDIIYYCIQDFAWIHQIIIYLQTDTYRVWYSNPQPTDRCVNIHATEIFEEDHLKVIFIHVLYSSSTRCHIK